MAKAPTKGLSTLNSMAFGLAVYASQGRLPDTTQDSLPVAGQALLDGVFTRKVPMKGFKVECYIFLFPFPKLAWRKRCNRPHENRKRSNQLKADSGPFWPLFMTKSQSTNGVGPRTEGRLPKCAEPPVAVHASHFSNILRACAYQK